MRILCNVVVCFLLLTSLAMGQGARTATLVGVVTDPVDAVVPDAAVTVRNTETSFVSHGVTNAEGAFYIPFLAVGTYEITVDVPGFKKFIQRGVQLRAGETPRINVRLEVGDTTQSIEVTASVPLLATETSQVTSTMEAQAIRSLPIQQMKAHRMLYYMEGLQIRGANASVLGQSSSALGFTLDGVSAKTSVRDEIGDTNTSVQPTLDALAEAKVYTTGVPAELGHASGGILSMTFKSGTNELHGSLDDRWTNQTMIHRGYLEEGKRTNPITFHQGQAMISGPVVIPKIYDGRNRTFFLFAYGRHHEKADEPQAGTVPDLNMLNGDFSFPQAPGGGYPIYDPASIRQVDGEWTADPFAGNVIPKSRFDPVAVNFLALKPWAEPNNPSGTTYTRTGPSNNWLGQTIYRSYRSRFDVKLDQQISPANKFFVRLSHNRHRQLGRIRGYLNNRLLDGATPSFGRPNPIDQQNWAFADYHTFSPTLMNEVRLGFARRVSTIDPPTANADWAQQLGIPNVGGANFPMFRSGTSDLYGIAPGAYSRNIAEEITFQNNTTKVLGRHVVKFGYEVLRTRENNIDQTLPSGSYSFTAAGSGLPFTPNTGHNFASFLLGAVNSAEFTQQLYNRLPRWWSHGLYVQTDWKVLPDLTLNLGVRYTVETPFRDKWGHQSQFDPTATDPLTGKIGAIIHPTDSLYKTDRNNFQPRIGLAWKLRPSMVFRGSFGVITQDVMPRVGFEEFTSTAYVQQLPGDPRPAFYLSQGPPGWNFIINPDGSSPYIGTNFAGRNATYTDPNLRLPYVMNWSAGLQVQLAPSWLTEWLYQGSAGVGLVSNSNINHLPEAIYKSTDLTLLNAAYAAGQNYKTYSHFGNVGFITNAGHNTYHGFIARVEKRYSPNGLTLNAHYTWSKNLTGSIGTGWQFYNWRLTKGPASFDTRHRIVYQGMYELPFGKGKKFLSSGGWLDAVVGGWNVVLVGTLQSGPPVTFSFAGSPYRYLPGPSRPNQLVPNEDVRIGNWTMGSHRFPQSAQNPLYDIKAFAYPAAFTPGTLGSGTQRGLWMFWPQWSLSKAWNFAERCSFTVRLDGINIPVRFMGTTPNTTVNLTSPESFGKFSLQTSPNYSTMGGANGQLAISGRFQF